MAALAGDPALVVTAVAPSKTFNIPGLGLSALIYPDPGQRRALRRVYDAFAVSASNPFSVAAFTAAYREGGPWLDALGPYLRGDRDLALDFFAGVDADRAGVLGTAAVGLEVVGERRYDRGGVRAACMSPRHNGLGRATRACR